MTISRLRHSAVTPPSGFAKTRFRHSPHSRGLAEKVLLGELAIARAELSSYKEHAPIGFHVLDRGGIILDVNSFWLSLLGYERREVVGRPIFDFIIPEQRDEARARFYAKINDEVPLQKTGDRKFLAKDGRTFPVETNDTVKRDRSGRVVRVHTSLQDISARRIAEEKLRGLEAQLHEFERTIALVNFAGEVIHTLKNQLRVLGTFLAELKEKESALQAILDKKPASEETLAAARAKACKIKTLVADIEKRFAHMGAYVYELLLISKINDEKKEPVKVKAALIDLIKLLDLHSKSKKVKIHFHPSNLTSDLELFISETGFKQMVMNLALNAIDAVENKPNAAVDLTIHVVDNTTLTVTISDNGDGIQPEKLVEIRKVLAEGGSVSTTKGKLGSGLGLAQVRRVVSSVDGRIDVESSKDFGTKFVVSFQLNRHLKVPGDIKAPVELSKDVAAGLRVLIVDDSDDEIYLLRRYLGKLGFSNITTLCSVADVEKHFADGSDQKYDVVITDRNLGTGDGLDVVAIVKAKMSCPAAIIINSSAPFGMCPEEYRVAVINAGVAYVEKSGNAKDLLSRIGPAILKYLELMASK